jgi:glycine dehydrogenase subunit 1
VSDPSPTAHPYMPNSVARAKQQMLAETGAASIAELFETIPADHRLKRPLELPRALSSEVELRRHLLDHVARNRSCERTLNFLGAGCWQHHVPAVCDEIVDRAEFLTPVLGTPSSDHGRYQAWFEFCSQIGELVGMDFVCLPVYSWGSAAGHAIRMAARLTERAEVLVPASLDPERLAVIANYCGPVEMAGHIDITRVAYDPASGQLDLEDLRRKLSSSTAAVYLENPCYLGVCEEQAAEIARLARAQGSETIVGVDPISLGVLEAPAQYGADIVIGTMQPLGVHMNCGGGTGGFIATRDEERYARQYPTLIVSIAETARAGQRGFANILMEQTSYGSREAGRDWTGNSVYLWAIAAAAYMALLGPQGFAEIGSTIVQRSHYAAKRLGAIEGLRVVFAAAFFKEFVINFDETGRTVAELNAALLEHGIFGGKDLSVNFPELGQAALFCVTEIHTQEDIDRLVSTLQQELER